MGEAEQPTCNGAFLSARLLWQLVSQTRVVISVLKTDRIVRRKVSIQTIYSSKDRCSRDIPQNQRNGSTTSLTVTHTVKRRKSRWRRPGPKKKFACYLCRLENTTCNDRPPPYSEYNHLSRKCSLVYLPIHDTHPPTPPLRRSSLPYIRRGSLYLFSNPSPQLPVFPISQRDAYYFQYLVSLHTSPTSTDFKSPIWGLLLQVTHFEPSLRHLVIATAMMHQSHHVNICVNYSSIISSLHLSASKHCSKAVRLLSNRLSKIQGRADTVTWELSFMACYLFTEFQSILGNEKGAHVWLRKGFRLLKGALCFYGSSDVDGSHLPFRIRETAVAFGRMGFSGVVL
ncbi:hypothetical protein N431DRAFT_394491 [Stipitochalara longipes BDJ]|nr:hypothetical protein N431DRAFT_394491 [Stipitochalara longipes BDJ]